MNGENKLNLIRMKYYLFIFFFSNLNIFSQTTVKGKISDQNGEPIVSASVILKTNTDDTIGFATSDENGKYEIIFEKMGNLIIQINSLGYETNEQHISIVKKNEVKSIDVILKTKETILEEVFIETKKSITVKNDTIIFNAKSFLRGDEQVVEDLLKKIPGLNITSDGTVKIGNQEVEKIMIDGDDMFEKGYKILTKNMPVNPIDKVELYQNYSNNKHLKGIENSDKVAINLTLKENYKRQWFGNMNIGYGLISENRYDTRSNLMNFGKKSKYYFLTNLNNIGYDAVGEIDNLIRPYRVGEPGSIGDNQSVKTLLSIGIETPDLKPKRTNFNNAEMISLNSIFMLSEKVKLKTIGFLNTDENDYFKNSFQSFIVGNETFINTEDLIGRKTKLIGFGKIDLIYDISKTKTLETTTKFNQTNENNSTSLFFNNDLLNEKLTSNNQLFDQKIVFTSKFQESKVFLLSSRYIYEKTPQEYFVNQFILQDLFMLNANNTNQYSQNKMQFVGIEAHLLSKKKNDDLFEIKLGNQLRIDNLKTKFGLLNNETSLSLPINFQNNSTYFVNNLYASLKYRWKINNFNFLTQSDFHQLFNELENLDSKINQTPFYIIPKIGIDWQINEVNKITSSYTYNTTNTGILDIYSGFVQTDFRSFSKGLEEFNQLNSSNLAINYTLGNWGDKFFANTFLIYSKNNDFYSNNSTITQNYSLSEKIIIKDREFLSLSSNIDYYFNFIKSNLKINLGGSKTNFKNIVNNSNTREVNNLNTIYGFELRSGFKGFFNYHFGSKWNYNQVKTTITNDFTNNISFLDLSFMFSKKFNIQLQSERYFFANLDINNNKYYFLDLEARYTVKENKLTFFLSGNNLFDTTTFKNYNITDIDISKTEYKLQPRYILLKMEFRF